MVNTTNELEMKISNIISAICGLFSHERANSLLRRSFPECNNIEHKTDCMRTVLEKARNNQDIFFSKITAIIRLHSKILTEKVGLLKALNRELGIMNLMYNLNTSELEKLPGFEPYLIRDPFLDVDKDLIRDEFYKRLIEEVNLCFGVKAYSSTMVMIRKLFENLVKDLLRKQFGLDSNKTHLYWKKDYFIGFNELILNLKKNIAEFKRYSQKIDVELIFFLKKSIQYSGNESAHTIEDSITLDQLEKLKEKVKYYLKLFLRVLK